MRTVLTLSILILLVSCGTQKIISYQYNVITRGYKKTVTVTQKKTLIEDVSRENKTVSVNTTPEMWKALQKESQQIELNEIATLTSPTNKRQFDGAMFAKLVLVTKDSIYTSAGFDHGYPPKMIKSVVDSISSIK